MSFLGIDSNYSNSAAAGANFNLFRSRPDIGQTGLGASGIRTARPDANTRPNDNYRVQRTDESARLKNWNIPVADLDKYDIYKSPVKDSERFDTFA